MIGPDRIVLGTAPLGGLFSAVDDRPARATLDRAWELGVRRFDSAPLYGSGLAEARLGRALRDRPRDELWVATKVGRLLRPGEPDPLFHGARRLAPVFDFSPAGIRRSLAESLERLELDRVDMVFVHDPDDNLAAGIAAAEMLRGDGYPVGVGTNDVGTALEFVRAGAIECVLLAGRYTLLDRSAEAELLPLCAAHGVTVLAAAAFNSGLLAGGSTFDYRPASAELRTRVRLLEERCASHDVPLAAAALRFPLRHPAVERIVVGARSGAEVEENLAHLGREIPEALWQEAPIADPPELPR